MYVHVKELVAAVRSPNSVDSPPVLCVDFVACCDSATAGFLSRNGPAFPKQTISASEQ